VKRLQLELGGKSASIVSDDVPEAHVASMSILTSMIHAGQGYALHNRVLPPEHLLVTGAPGGTGHQRPSHWSPAGPITWHGENVQRLDMRYHGNGTSD
jgi:hypothetical protein